ncbi:MAG TPA: pyridoxal-dependent decarboxylase [Gemmatimonadaceae bacterium]|nr:pyridoxal-dependent decarboxylase [Gemmatimonadaceae bacterium]
MSDTRTSAHAALDRALEHAAHWLDGLDTRSVGATTSLEELRARLAVPLSEHGTDPVRVIDELAAATEGGLLGSPGGRFYAWVIGGSLPSALAADWLTSAWDQNAGMYATAPAAAIAEEVAGAWLLEMLDLPRDASFAFVTGCQMAHVTALAAARSGVLRDAGWNVETDGLFGAPRIRVLATAPRHSTIDRALRFLGIGERSVRPVATDAKGRVTASALEEALASGSGPTIVVLAAGDLNTGEFDPFRTLIPIARSAGAWVHVDGAFGLMARASAAKRALLDGVELADSWATDAHKWLNVPYDSGIAIVRDRAAHRAAMTVSASYLSPNDRTRDEVDWNPEFSRRARGFALYAALRELGRSGLASLVDRCCAYCHAIVTGIGALRGAELLWTPELNQGLVRFLDERSGATDNDHDVRTDAVIAAINASGEAFFGGVTWNGKRAMRVSVVNWRTDEGDVARAIDAARSAIASVASQQSPRTT